MKKILVVAAGCLFSVAAMAQNNDAQKINKDSINIQSGKADVYVIPKTIFDETTPVISDTAKATTKKHKRKRKHCSRRSS